MNDKVTKECFTCNRKTEHTFNDRKLRWDCTECEI